MTMKAYYSSSIKEELKHKGVMQLTSDEYLSQLMGAMYSGKCNTLLKWYVKRYQGLSACYTRYY